MKVNIFRFTFGFQRLIFIFVKLRNLASCYVVNPLISFDLNWCFVALFKLLYFFVLVSFNNLNGVNVSDDYLPRYFCGNESLILRFARTRQTDVFFLTG